MAYIVIAEKNEDRRNIRTTFLERRGHSVAHVENGFQAQQLVLSSSIDVLILDLGLDKISGIDLINRLHQRKYTLPIIVLSYTPPQVSYEGPMQVIDPYPIDDTMTNAIKSVLAN